MQPELSTAEDQESPGLMHCKQITEQPKNRQGKLARATSDPSSMSASTIMEQGAAARGSEVESVECACCGMSEDCTPIYIKRIREFFEGKWICGLCSEAVKELQMRRGAASKEQALETHMALCEKYNRTIRLNPKLSLAVSMRDIARKSSERRTTTTTMATMNSSKIVRAMSCGPRLEVNIKQSQIQ